MAESAFWTYSLAVYARPGVAEACLTLQDEDGADVNVLLYLMFLAHQGRQIDAATTTAIAALARPWSEAVVVPLRGLRRRLKTAIGSLPPERTAALRTEVKRIELESERVLQETLETAMPPQALGHPADDRSVAAKANLTAYARLLGLAPAKIEPLLACFSSTKVGSDRANSL